VAWGLRGPHVVAHGAALGPADSRCFGCRPARNPLKGRAGELKPPSSPALGRDCGLRPPRSLGITLEENTSLCPGSSYPDGQLAVDTAVPDNNEDPDRCLDIRTMLVM